MGAVSLHGDTQTDPSDKGSGQNPAGKIRKKSTSSKWTDLTFEQYVRGDMPDEGQGVSSKSGSEIMAFEDENYPRLSPEIGAELKWQGTGCPSTTTGPSTCPEMEGAIPTSTLDGSMPHGSIQQPHVNNATVPVT